MVDRDSHTSHHDVGEGGRSPLIESYAARGMEYLLSYAKPHFGIRAIKMLDLGCDYGFCLNYLHNSFRNDRDCLGIDPYHKINPFGLPIAKISMCDPELDFLVKEHFQAPHVDLVVFNHSLEHVENPYIPMRAVKKLLARDGLVFIAVPDHKSRWAYWEQHYTLWSMSWLLHFMKLNGFRALSCTHETLRDDLTELWAVFQHAPAAELLEVSHSSNPDSPDTKVQT